MKSAIDRVVREIAAVRKITDKEAMKAIEEKLAKAPKRGAKGAEGDGEDAQEEEAA